MGNTLDSSNPKYDNLYKKKGLELPDEQYYTHDFEKKLFMAMNIFRLNPLSFEKYILNLKKTHPDFEIDKETYKRANLHLTYLDKRRHISIGSKARQACLNMNALIDDDQDPPDAKNLIEPEHFNLDKPDEGTVLEYKKLPARVGREEDVIKSFTICNW